MNVEPIRLFRPYIDFEDVEREFRDVFDSGIFTRGPNVEAFTAELAAYLGAPHVFPATSATTALWVCLRLLNIGPGDEVAVADFSFPASANVVEDVGARPVFVDVSPDSYTMRVDDLEAKIGPRTKAVIFVDALGNPTGLHDIKAVCVRAGIPLIEDAACAIGSGERGRKCGEIADLTCFSFHPRKLLSTGEGGAITTARDDWADWLRVKLAHGASGPKGLGFDFVDFGYNFRLPELQAIMGRKQLARLDGVIDSRLAVRSVYVDLLEPLGFVPQQVGDDVHFNVQSLVFRVPEHLDRDRLVAMLKAQGVEATLGTYCLSSTTYYGGQGHDLQPVSASLEATTIALPCYDGVPVEQVAELIRQNSN